LLDSLLQETVINLIVMLKRFLISPTVRGIKTKSTLQKSSEISSKLFLAQRTPSLVNCPVRHYSSNMSSGPVMRQLFDRESCTYTYLLYDKQSKEAVLIDPVIEHSERDAQTVQQLDLKLKYVINTHVHADHITGTGRLKKLIPGCKSILSKASGGQADLLVADGEKIVFGAEELEVAATPGHTEGCVTYIDRKAGRAFTGDALLVRGCGRTDFQGGSAKTLYASVWSKILSLPDDFLLFPAHDYKGQTQTTVAEEKKYNPRLTKDEAGFIAIMEGLNLAYPKKIDESLPANMVCGLTDLPERMKDWV